MARNVANALTALLKDLGRTGRASSGLLRALVGSGSSRGSRSQKTLLGLVGMLAGPKTARNLQKSITQREREDRRQAKQDDRDAKRIGREMRKAAEGRGGGRGGRPVMIAADSSNVHSYGYDPDSQTLYVRFRNKTKVGALYAYYHVPPEIYKKLDAAGSKGGAVWDLLRERGTVHGHKFDYRLVGIRGGYVPRKATVKGLKPRDFKKRGKVYSSKKPWHVYG